MMGRRRRSAARPAAFWGGRRCGSEESMTQSRSSASPAEAPSQRAPRGWILDEQPAHLRDSSVGSVRAAATAAALARELEYNAVLVHVVPLHERSGRAGELSEGQRHELRELRALVERQGFAAHTRVYLTSGDGRGARAGGGRVRRRADRRRLPRPPRTRLRPAGRRLERSDEKRPPALSWWYRRVWPRRSPRRRCERLSAGSRAPSGTRHCFASARISAGGCARRCRPFTPSIPGRMLQVWPASRRRSRRSFSRRPRGGSTGRSGSRVSRHTAA
jgi:hypothetical protein